LLERLSIADLALVERAEIEFGPGLNVVTGETGAGKTLLVDALALLVGGRPETDAVREGARTAVIVGEIRVPPERSAAIAELTAEWGSEFDGEALIVRREVQASGRSRAVVNQTAVTQGALQKLGDLLADLHGQHEHQSLLRPEGGLETLDGLAGLDLLREQYRESLAEWRDASLALERLDESLRRSTEQRDEMRETLREIEEARLVEGEEESLARDAGRLAHADRLRSLVARTLVELSEGENAVVDRLGVALHALEHAATLDTTLADVLPTVREAEIAASEAAHALSTYGQGLESDPAALERVEARRDRLARLTRKYRRNVSELLDWHTELAAELAAGENADAARTALSRRVEHAESECRGRGARLSKARAAAAGEWSAALTCEMKPLGMPAARLEFVVEPRETEGGMLHPLGLDRVEMSFFPNPGEPGRPLQKIASGGELSRVMLALKCALQASDRVDLLVFDEVDSGIGGAVAQAVGERLRRLSEHRQVVCVTHLPMIAALASHHLRVIKRTRAGRTVTSIEMLEGAERVEELARMLAGNRVTETTRRQARELLSPPRVHAR
jgi:DNA repair protein RecN (Recombination protein N)